MTTAPHPEQHGSAGAAGTSSITSSITSNEQDVITIRVPSQAKTIQEAVDMAEEEEGNLVRIVISPGIYHESFTLRSLSVYLSICAHVCSCVCVCIADVTLQRCMSYRAGWDEQAFVCHPRKLRH